jgi:glucan endo-1,3-alpha-glucosidase
LYGSYGTSSGCTTKCVNNPGETCGGVNANSVYHIQYDVEPLTIGYKGCYGDSASSRDLNVVKPGIGTIQECAGYCSKYEYFGVQFGSQCYCGNSYGRYGTTTGCTSQCSSNSTQTCGGAYANSVYSYSASPKRKINIL